jgi:hypothetical protein
MIGRITQIAVSINDKLAIITFNFEAIFEK